MKKKTPTLKDMDYRGSFMPHGHVYLRGADLYAQLGVESNRGKAFVKKKSSKKQ